MISYLSVRNFKLAEAVELDFETGFTTLTGETGAGKSLIIDAVALLLGERARPETIAGQADKAEIQGIFLLEENHAAHRWLIEHELESGAECVIRRIITRKSGSRAMVNGSAVPVQNLKQLGELLVDILGQHEHQLLAGREHQRNTLDAFACIETEVVALSQTFDQLSASRSRFDKLRNRSEADRERARLLEFQIAELTELEPKPGEEEALHQEYNRLAHAQELMQGVSTLMDSLYDAEHDSVNQRLNQAAQSITSLAEHDGELTPLGERLDSLAIEVSELAADLRRCLDGYEHEPERFQQVQRRLDQLHDVARKYRVEVHQLGPLLEDCSKELGEIAADDDTLRDLESEIQSLEASYNQQAQKISKKRNSAGKQLSEQVQQELADLGMPGARFEISFEPLAEAKAWGLESAEFLISTNPGQAPGPLSRVASGGELSRVTLAINMVSNRGIAAYTQIYDEVDVGIGGGIAEMVGQKLRALGNNKQVLCVTHLPQVASQAQHHKKVSKRAADTTSVRITALSENERTREIARMLGGIEMTERTLEHAAEMLARANQ